jgi:4-hydroxyphenylpyruvate dioxygenase
MTPARARTLLEDHGLRFAGGCQGRLLTFAAPAQVTASHNAVVKNAELIAALGGKVVTVGTDPIEWPQPKEAPDPIGRIAESARAVADRILPYKVDLLIEFNWGMVKTLFGAVEVARRSGAANVGVLFDPAHFYSTPTKTEHLRPETVRYIRHVHVDDMPAAPSEVTDCDAARLLPGDPRGCCDLVDLFSRLERHGYRGDYCIEMLNAEGLATEPAVAAKRMFESMQGVFSKIPGTATGE